MTSGFRFGRVLFYDFFKKALVILVNADFIYSVFLIHTFFFLSSDVCVNVIKFVIYCLLLLEVIFLKNPSNLSSSFLCRIKEADIISRPKSFSNAFSYSFEMFISTCPLCIWNERKIKSIPSEKIYKSFKQNQVE